MHTTVLVVGAGLSGLLTAYRLASKSIDVQLVEARPILGGRILSYPFPGADNASVDMGPSWFWPGQFGMHALIDELNLQGAVYGQHSHGLCVLEYANGQIQQSAGGASMAGSLRLEGGMQRLVNTLASLLEHQSIHLDANVLGIRDQQQSVTTTVSINEVVQHIDSQFVVLAIPPRVAASAITFDPDLPASYLQALQQRPTWMAAQAKCVAIYSSAFWRSEGLSGDGISQRGPLTEIHDASVDDASHAALFGFISVPEHLRLEGKFDVKQAVIEQLVRMFGKQASSPLVVHIKDWAQDPHTCTPFDLQPAQRVAPEFEYSKWGGRLVWAGSETASHATHANGYLEGAVEAAHRASDNVMQSLSEI